MTDKCAMQPATGATTDAIVGATTDAIVDRQQVFNAFWREARANGFAPHPSAGLHADAVFLVTLRLTTQQTTPSAVEFALRYLAADYGLAVSEEKM